MAQFFLCGTILGLLLISLNVKHACCHDEQLSELDVINNTVKAIQAAHENIRADIDGLHTVLLEDIKAAGLLDVARQEPELNAPIEDVDTPTEETKSDITTKLDSLEQIISALEHFVYHEMVESKNELRSLRGTSGEGFNSIMENVRKHSDDMIQEVDGTLAEVREELKETEATANSRNVIVGDLLYYQGIASTCGAWYESCSVADSECRDNKCQCAPGLSYDSLRQRCVEKCPHGYGDTYQVVHNYIIRGFNNLSLNETSLDDCKALCENEVTFQCRSFDYFPDGNENCFLSEHTKLTAEDGWEYNGVGVHFQRDCVYDKY